MAERERHTFAPLPARVMADEALADIDAWRESPVEAEAVRQRSTWTNYCRGRRRRPPLTQSQKKRLPSICIGNSPREILAAAWAGATTRDRLDLIERVTGGASNGL